MIHFDNIYASVDESEILHGVSLRFELWKNYCILGKNGSGKSTLSQVLMGHPRYTIRSWSLLLEHEGNTQNLQDMSPDERSHAGIFLSFQNIPEIPWITLQEYLRTIYNIAEKQRQRQKSEEAGNAFLWLSPFMFKRFIKKYLKELHIEEEMLARDVNVGFSGGEKRKIEILQMKLIQPRYIILDEVDSGLDLDAFRLVAQMLQTFMWEDASLIIITHYFTILEYIPVDVVYVMQDGKILKQGSKELVEEIKKNGFTKL